MSSEIVNTMSEISPRSPEVKQDAAFSQNGPLNPNAAVFNHLSLMTLSDKSPTAQTSNTVTPSHWQENGEEPNNPVGAMANSLQYSPQAVNGYGESYTSPGPSTDMSQSQEVSPDKLPLKELKALLQRQLEYYFSRENLSRDAYLLSQMDRDNFVPIWTVANFNQIKKMTKDIELVKEVLRESPLLQMNELCEKVRANVKRCIVVLREIPESTPIEEVKALFEGEGCPKHVKCEFISNDYWYIYFENEERAQKAYQYLREVVKTFKGKPIMARIKANTIHTPAPSKNVPPTPPQAPMYSRFQFPPPVQPIFPNNAQQENLYVKQNGAKKPTEHSEDDQSHEKKNDDSTGSVDQELENKDDECCEILINISIKKKCSILPSLDSDDYEPLCVSCEVSKKIGINEKRVTFTVQSNGCGQGPVQESGLIGYERLTSSETEVPVGKEAYMSVALGKLLKVKWKLEQPFFLTFPLEKSEEQEREKQLKLWVSLESEKELIFGIPITIDIAQCGSEVLGHVGMSKSLSRSTKAVPSPVTSNLTPNEKRWDVAGLYQNKCLLPILQKFIKSKMNKHYGYMKKKHKIDKQSYKSHLKKDIKKKLNYESINNNAKKEKKKKGKKKKMDYNYDVKSADDLAKLYLKPSLAKFKGLDHTYDMSVALGVLSSASVFSPKIRNLAWKVRENVRNPCAHCIFVHWDETKFETRFQLMENLLKVLPLPSDEEQKAVNELKYWQTKGVAHCMGNPVDATS